MSKPIVNKVNSLPKTKIIALLNFNDDIDKPILKTLNYFFDTVPRFYRFPIVNTDGSTTKILSLLDEYYAKGYRYFYGFAWTPVFLAVQEWFKNHPQAQGVGTSRIFIGRPQPIFRLLRPNDIITTSIETVEGYDSVFFIYNKTNALIVGRDEYLKNRCSGLGIPYNSYPLSNLSEIETGDFVNITMNDINEIILSNNYKKSSIMIQTGAPLQNAFFNKYVYGTTPKPANSTFYNIVVTLPLITEPSAQTYFQNVTFYSQTTGNLNSSPLWRQGLDDLGQQDYSLTTLNALNVLYKLDNVNGYVSQLGSYSDSLIFDLVTRDQVYESLVYNLYNTDNVFVPKIIYYSSQDGIVFKSQVK